MKTITESHITEHIELNEVDTNTHSSENIIATPGPNVVDQPQTHNNLVTHQNIAKIFSNVVPYSNTRKSTEIITKGMAIIFGTMSGIPVVNIARQFFGENYRILGWVSGGCVIISSATISTWAWSNLFTKAIKDIPQEAKENTCFMILKIGSLIGCAIAATGSLIPNLYATFKYNNNNILWPLMSFISECGIRTYAFYELTSSTPILEQILMRKELSFYNHLNSNPNTTKKMQKLRDDFYNTCMEGVIAFNSYGQKFRLRSYPNFFRSSENIINSPEYIEQIIKSLYLGGLREKNQNDSYLMHFHSWGKRLLLTFTLGFPVSILYLFYNLSYEAMGYITDNIPARIILSLITILPNAYLDFFSLKSIIYNVTDQIINSLICKNKYSLAYQMVPATVSASYVFASVVTLFTLPVIAKISSDIFTSSFGHVITAFNVVQVMIYALNAAVDVINKSIENFLLFWGDDSAKQLVGWSHKLQQLLDTMKKMDLPQFGNFINTLTDKTFQKKILDTTIDIDEVKNFILETSQKKNNVDNAQIISITQNRFAFQFSPPANNIPSEIIDENITPKSTNKRGCGIL